MRYTYDEIKQEFENRGYELISTEYVDADTKLEYICPKHKEQGVQRIDFRHLHRGQGCRFCGQENKKSGRQKDLVDYNAKELTESKGMEFINITRENSKLYIYYICPKHRQYGVQKTTLQSMQRKKIGCPYCIGKNKTTESFKKDLFKINSNIEVLGEYISAKSPIQCRCKIDGTEWFPRPNNLLNGEGCPECGRIASNKNGTKANEKFLLQLKEINKNITPLEEYVQAKIKIWVSCKICEHKWQVTPDNLLSGNGCPECAAPKHEKKLINFLTGLGYSVETQKKYNDCRDILPLPFDLYIKELNLLIEYDGEQHYMPVNFGGISDDEALINFQTTKRHDQIKNDYCEENNIPLIRIPYWEKNNLFQFLIDNINNKIHQQHKINVVNN